MNVTLFSPASSPRDSSMISVSKPRRSAHLRYMRSSISTQSCASTPPWPTEMVTTALWFAYVSVNNRSSSWERSSFSTAACSSATCFSSSGSSSPSCSSSRTSRARLSRRSHVAICSLFSAASRAIWPACFGSSQTPGWVSCASSSSALFPFAGRSKVLLELEDPFQELFRVQFSVHQISITACVAGRTLPAVAPLVFLTRSAPARIVAADFMLRAAGSVRAPGGDRRSHRSCTALLWRGPAAGPIGAVRLGGSAFRHLAHDRSRRRGRSRRHPVDQRHDRALDALAQLVEHLERFVLVLDQRVALAVRAQSDALAELLHLRQVFHPLPVDRLQHHAPLDDRHQLGAHLCHLPVVGFLGGRVKVLDEALDRK